MGGITRTTETGMEKGKLGEAGVLRNGLAPARNDVLRLGFGPVRSAFAGGDSLFLNQPLEYESILIADIIEIPFQISKNLFVEFRMLPFENALPPKKR
jgi:hypothetical protein